MKPWLPVGRVVFGVAMAALGIENLVYGEGVFGLEPVPMWVPGRSAFAYLTGCMLVVAGLILASGRGARTSATVLAGLLSFWVLLLQLPPLVSALYNGGLWTTTFETLALCSAAWVLASLPPRFARAARVCFGASLFVFAVLHVVYEAYVTSVIPGWIPAALFWTYFTAAAFLAAGLAIVSGVQGRLAAALLGAMFGSWVLLVHVPRVLASPTARPEWTSLLIALAMCGAGFILAGSAPERSATP
jgi:uncharacterized membrane protein YphA (DoxX/SURF4 family)